MIEHFFQCPYCFEEISMLIDTSIPDQAYVEDCEVCCNPIDLTVRLNGDVITAFEANDLGQ